MNTKATATLTNGSKVRGKLTTEHAVSSYGQPVFVGNDGTAYNWADITDISTTAARSKGGKATSQAKAKAARENGKKGGRPPKAKPSS